VVDKRTTADSAAASALDVSLAPLALAVFRQRAHEKNRREEPLWALDSKVLAADVEDS